MHRVIGFVEGHGRKEERTWIGTNQIVQVELVLMWGKGNWIKGTRDNN